MKTRDEILADIRWRIEWMEARSTELGANLSERDRQTYERLSAEAEDYLASLGLPRLFEESRLLPVRDRLKRSGVSLEFDMIQRSRRPR